MPGYISAQCLCLLNCYKIYLKFYKGYGNGDNTFAELGSSPSEASLGEVKLHFTGY